MVQVHKKFTDEQVKNLLERYLKGEEDQLRRELCPEDYPGKDEDRITQCPERNPRVENEEF